MTAIEIEYDETPAEAENSQETTPAEQSSEPHVQETIDWSSRKVKDLSKDERQKLIHDHEAGIDNEYFKVQQLKNGSVRIVKRSNPLTASSTEAKINDRYTGKRLTTEQLLMEHVLDLERKYEVMRHKHKRLKKRYNKLENDLFDSDDEEVPAAEVSVRSHERKEVDEVIENPVKVREPEQLPREPIITAAFRKRSGKPSWRNMISNM